MRHVAWGFAAAAAVCGFSAPDEGLAPVPKTEWAALCGKVLPDNGVCWSFATKAFRERYPAVPVDWEGCRDAAAAQRWAWAALMEKDGNAEYAAAVKRACGKR